MTPEISVIIPVYNEAGHIDLLVRQVIQVMENLKVPYEVLIIDDGSTDGTLSEAELTGACILKHPYNIGNGAAVKRGVREAKGSVIVLMDGDGQHNPFDIPILLKHYPEYNMVVGERAVGSETVWYRNLGNCLFNILASYSSGRKIKDLTSGFRVIKASIMRQFLYLLPNTYSYPSTITLAVIRSGYTVKYVPILGRKRLARFGGIKPMRDGIKFLNIILRITIFFAPMKMFLPLSALLFIGGVGWWFIRVFISGLGFPPISIVLILVSFIIFAIGLISEQIALLRFQYSENQ